MHILITNTKLFYVQLVDLVSPRENVKIYSICVNMDYLYV